MPISDGSLLPVTELLTITDLGPRFQACVEIVDAIWRAGFDACRTDWERGNWIFLYRDYCVGERLVHYDGQINNTQNPVATPTG